MRRDASELDDFPGALDVTLSAEQFSRLDEVSAVPLGVPHEATAAILDALLGGDAGRVAGPRMPVA